MPGTKSEPFFIRNLQPDDLGDAMALSSGEGWNQTAKDWSFLITNPGSVAIGVIYKGRIIATTSAIHYSGKIIWIGMVLVDKAFRGRGISKLLLNHVFQHRDEGSTLKLDATPQGQQVYLPLGFREEFQIARMVRPANSDNTITIDGTLPEQAQSSHVPEIVVIDEQTFGAGRASLIKMLTTSFPEKAWVIKQEQQITGFALGRAGNRYHHIGPVAASNTADALLLITHALNQLEGNAVVLDVLCTKQKLTASLVSMGFSIQRNFSRMYRQDNPYPCSIENWFAICGPEYG